MSGEAESVPKKAYLYFANLDGIRAIAALMVVLSHIQLHKKLQGIQHQDLIDFKNFGKIGVTIFFTLSGFLITYLLLEEKKRFKKVSFKAFYIRRILRIWPLYFLLILVGFFVYPAEGSMHALWLSLFLMPNVAFCMKLLPNIFDPIWSIGVEEQFYIFHPHIFRQKKVQNILYTLTGILIVLVALNLTVRYYQYQSQFLLNLDLFLYFTRFDDMMIGAIVALLYFNTKNNCFTFGFQSAFNLLLNKYFQMALAAAFIAFICLFVHKEIGQGDLIISAFSALMMVYLCEPGTTNAFFGNKAVAYCGKISYGIYLLHKYPLMLMLYIVRNYIPPASTFWQTIILYLGTIVLVVLLASVSYFGFERYFLRMKSRFQKITSNKLAATNAA
ncbi:acyltransferase [Mucilaginibacter sp. ZT4R22]|uniref:Acyltransferase n=1 Tax=Mucilaginibacter pankratovii TaxID=2772110 RepID=A0ABR7WQL4_9SPHI|nr:acyltransferase [Mucilaginibacter pankratovii]MBD1364606.1 acyltransferase [Mucilaginibacter pankratovii]